MNKICVPEESSNYAMALRMATAECLAKGEMNVEDIIKVLKKLHQHDKEDYTDEQIEEDAYLACELAHKTPAGRKPISALIAEYIDTIRDEEKTVTFDIKDVYRDLKLDNPVDRSSCRMALHRISGDVLERVGEKSGIYRILVNKAPLQTIDLWADDKKPLRIKYPLGIHELVITHPKNIIIVAGEPNAGKSAYLLNFAQMNMGRDHEVIYFSSEMGALELKSRLKKFSMPLDEWRKVKWVERSSDFHDVIQPDGINIIDFLEVNEEFYKVALLIRKIFEKLNNGIAFIALQKNKGRDEGVGGMMSLEKARLYLAMKPGEIKIVKGKNWRNDEVNPNGLCRSYKLGGGCNFKAEGDWFKS